MFSSTKFGGSFSSIICLILFLNFGKLLRRGAQGVIGGVGTAIGGKFGLAIEGAIERAPALLPQRQVPHF